MIRTNVKHAYGEIEQDNKLPMPMQTHHQQMHFLKGLLIDCTWDSALSILIVYTLYILRMLKLPIRYIKFAPELAKVTIHRWGTPRP